MNTGWLLFLQYLICDTKPQVCETNAATLEKNVGILHLYYVADKLNNTVINMKSGLGTKAIWLWLGKIPGFDGSILAANTAVSL